MTNKKKTSNNNNTKKKKTSGVWVAFPGFAMLTNGAQEVGVRLIVRCSRTSQEVIWILNMFATDRAQVCVMVVEVVFLLMQRKPFMN